jgi:osmotically-inducible protein OsmY
VAAYADDSTISNSIRARFLEDPVVNFGDVGVTTLNGNVRLTGRVNWSANVSGPPRSPAR